MAKRVWQPRGGPVAIKNAIAAARKKGRQIQRPEQALHLAVAEFLDAVLLPPALWKHVPNGGKRSKIEAGIMKAMGVRAGWPDIEIIWPVAVDSGGVQWTALAALEIELKADDGDLSPAQEKMHKLLWGASIPVVICRSIEEVSAALIKYDVPCRQHTTFPNGGRIVHA